MSNKIVFPGSFDPITNGHMNIIERAAKIFDHVIVAVGNNTLKSSFLSHTQRLHLVKEIFASISNIEVLGFNTLLIDFVKECKANVILRSLRSGTDFDYESQLAAMNQALAPDIETIFLPPLQQFSHISSSLVREIASLGGDISPFVPPKVMEVLTNAANKRIGF